MANLPQITVIKSAKNDPNWRRGLVVSPPLATEKMEAMGRKIESRQGIR
jgi:hypothetical protein